MYTACDVQIKEMQLKEKAVMQARKKKTQHCSLNSWKLS